MKKNNNKSGRSLLLQNKHKSSLPSRNAIVVKSNALVEASFDLTVQQLRLVHWLVRVVQENDEDYKYYEIDVPLFLEYLQLKGSNSARERIREVTKQLQERTILLRRGDEEWEQFSWLRYSRIVKRDNRLVLRLSINPEMIPYITNLKSAFTKVPFYMMPAFKTRYSWRFYEWFKQFADTGWFIITVDDLRSRLRFGEQEYARFNNLRQKVITPALREVNEVSDLDVALVAMERKGRSIHMLKFKITEKTAHVIPMRDGDLDEHNLIIQRLVSYGMPSKEASKNIKKFYEHDREHLLNCLADVERKIEERFEFQDGNPLIWLRYILSNDQRSQPTLFAHTNSAPKMSREESDALKAKLKQRRDAQQRHDYLNDLSNKAHRDFRKKREAHMAEQITEIPEDVRTAWVKNLKSEIASALAPFVREPDIWSHPIFTRETDQFLAEHGLPVFTSAEHFASIGFDDEHTKAEMKRLEELIN